MTNRTLAMIIAPFLALTLVLAVAYGAVEVRHSAWWMLLYVPGAIGVGLVTGLAVMSVVELMRDGV